MNAIRNFFFILIIFSTHLFSYEYKNNNPEINVWVEQYCSILSRNEIQLIANFLYFSHVSGTINNQIKEIKSNIIHYYLSLNNLSYENNEKLNSIYKKYNSSAQLKLDKSLTNYQLYFKAYNNCLNHLETIDNTLLIDAIEKLRDNIQKQVIEYTNAQKDLLIKQCNEQGSVCLKNAKQLDNLSRFYNKADIATSTLSAEHSSIYFYNYQHVLSEELKNTIKQLLPCIDQAETEKTKLEQYTIAIYKAYYDAILNYASSNNQSLYVMFDDSGLINELTNLLPLKPLT